MSPAKQQVVSFRTVQRMGGLAGVVAAMAMSCGALNGGCLPSSPEPGGGEKTQAPATPPSGQVDRDRHRATEPVGPVYTAEILAARVRAQTRLLGADKLFEDAQGQVVLPWSAPKTAPVASGSASLLDAMPGSAGLDAQGTPTRASVNGNALGVFVPIESGDGVALDGFYRRLRALAAGRARPGDKVRVLVYGASHTQADIYTSYLRYYLQQRFGNGGRGFVSLAKANRWHRPPNLRIDNADGVVVLHAQRRSAPDIGAYGLMGLRAEVSGRRDWLRIEPRDATDISDHGSMYELHYLVQPEGGKLALHVDGAARGVVETHGEQQRAAFYSVALEPGPHAIEVRPKGRGSAVVYGVTIENDRAGVVVDTLGISGTRASNMLRWDESAWAESISHRDPALFVLAYGTNEATDRDQPIDAYEAQLRRVLQRFQTAVPDASCLLVGPGDFPRKAGEKEWVERPRVQQIIEVQRNLAEELGCGFWDALAFMGGVGSMHLWATSKPQMAAGDHIHFTRRGYVRMGMALTDALMVDYDLTK
ncbi:MAG: hypothetical protein B7733_18310 [Myxococcales bacterium FL481]|nr:MAG: hypothetical protein B7733_18310 [Myxococcales bacterium FL481]